MEKEREKRERRREKESGKIEEKIFFKQGNKFFLFSLLLFILKKGTSFPLLLFIKEANGDEEEAEGVAAALSPPIGGLLLLESLLHAKD